MKTGALHVFHVLSIVCSIFFGLFLLTCFGFLIDPLLEVLFHLLFGWLFFITKSLSHVTLFWPSISTGIVAFVFVLFGTHSSIKWFKAAGDSKYQGNWKFRWSLSVVLLVVAAFVTGITMVGIVHQLYWFSRDRTSFRHDEYFGKIVCVGHLEEIQRAKQQWAAAVGAKDEDPVDVDGVNQYLKGKKMPTCPNGGEYVYGRLQENPTCTFTNTRPNLIHQLRLY